MRMVTWAVTRPRCYRLLTALAWIVKIFLLLIVAIKCAILRRPQHLVLATAQATNVVMVSVPLMRTISSALRTVTLALTWLPVETQCAKKVKMRALAQQIVQWNLHVGMECVIPRKTLVLALIVLWVEVRNVVMESVMIKKTAAIAHKIVLVTIL